jgi:imidazole glycerol phosphate synthase glutamine amidotransferase subunit
MRGVAQLDTAHVPGDTVAPVSTPRRIAIVDYGAGNVTSVQHALLRALTPASLHVEVRLTAAPDDVTAADLVVFPGQGHFGHAMAQLRTTGLALALHETARAGKPFVGICLGMQLLFEGSDEAPGEHGLGLLPGRCVRFEAPRKVPQIGWNTIDLHGQGSALDGLQGRHFYFAHSFHVQPAQGGDVLATSDYRGPFVAAVRRGNLLGVQFHPEKSGRAGERFWRQLLGVREVG